MYIHYIRTYLKPYGSAYFKVCKESNYRNQSLLQKVTKETCKQHSITPANYNLFCS